MNSNLYKSYQNVNQTSLIQQMPVIIDLRVENFFHPKLSEAAPAIMAHVMKFVVDNIPPATFAYSHMDNITIVLPFINLDGFRWKNNLIKSYISNAASLASLKFNELVNKHFDDLPHFVFDCNVYNVPDDRVVGLFIWKQNELSSLALHTKYEEMFPDELVPSHISDNDKVDGLMRLDIPIRWNDQPIHVKRGIAYNKVSGKVDALIPMFSHSTEYIQMHLEYFEPDDCNTET